MTKRKRKTNKTILPESIDVARYTYDTWQKCYPESNENEWILHSFPNNVFNFAHNTLDGLNTNKEIDATNVNNIKTVVLGDEFFQWLKEKNKENTPVTRAEYITFVDEETAQLLAKKYRMHFNLDGYAIPIMIASDKKFSEQFLDLHMNKETRSKLTHLLRETYQEENIYVVPYYMTPETFYTEYDTFERLAVNNIFDKVDVKVEKFATQNYPDEEVYVGVLLVGFFIAEECGAIINKSDLFETSENTILKRCPERVMFCTEDNYRDVVDEKDHILFMGNFPDEIINGIKNDLCDDGLLVTPCTVGVWDIPSFMLDFCRAMMEDLK